MSTYTAVTDADRETMLSAIGVEDVEDLFAGIPADLRLDHPLDLPPGAPEQDVYAHLRDLAARNVSTEDELSFLGGGMYDHYVPAIVDMLMSRSEFLTPYTPYQPEVSQGGLQVMFEYQTAISELTALPVANASVYDGPSAVASAGYLARLANGRTRFVVSEGLHPHAREALRTYAHGFGAQITEVPLRDGRTDADAWAAAMDDDTCAAFFQNPNFLGAVEDAATLASAVPDPGVVVGSYDPIALGILRPPGECGVDVCVGEGQAGLRGAVVRLLRSDRGVPAPDARADRGRDRGRRGPARLRPHAPDARAAHPPGEGDVEHLHRPGAQRPGRRRLPDVARSPGARRARRAAAPAHALRP
jgi:glycine dehydrogenase subunit 1